MSAAAAAGALSQAAALASGRCAFSLKEKSSRNAPAFLGLRPGGQWAVAPDWAARQFLPPQHRHHHNEPSPPQRSVSARAVTSPAAPPQASDALVNIEKDVGVVQIAPDTTAVRARCQDRLKFEVEYNLKRGTTNNSYIIKGEDSLALIDIPDQAWAQAFVDAVEQDVGLANVTHLVLGHFSPKRAESMIALVTARGQKAPRLQVYCSNPAAQGLAAGLPSEVAKLLDVQTVRGGETLDLGGGHDLRFILSPTPRWPDGLITYDPATRQLFTNKFFSAHASLEDDFDVGGWDVYGKDWEYFYECMVAPAAKQARVVLERLPIVAQPSGSSYVGKRGLAVVKEDVNFIIAAVRGLLKLDQQAQAQSSKTEPLVVRAICPAHGPIVRSALTELVREYREWTESTLKKAQEASVVVIYASAYGNTSSLAQAICRGISKAGVSVESINCEFSSPVEVAEAVRKSSGFVIGSPTLAGHMPTPVQEALGAILKTIDSRDKPAGVFGSFGWSGEAVDQLEQRLKDGGFSFAFPPIRCKFKPTAQMLQLCEESGTDLAQAVQKAKLTKSSPREKATLASDVEQAVGRVVGSLCVLSARDGDAQSAMLASWVSQASFNPPGLTIAVAKDRAIESLVLPGGGFTINVLGEGKASAVSRQLLKPFQPGEARFGDLETEEAPNGCVILKDAISYMDCTVTDRMEVGDHWLIYANVNEGKLQDPGTLTAVHHRKTGARY